MSELRVTRKVKQGPVDIDVDDCALIVNYEIETVEVDSRGSLVEVLDRKPEVRRIKIKSLSPDKNMAQLANDIIDKCKYIHPSRAEEIEALLIQLRRAKMAQPDNTSIHGTHNIQSYQDTAPTSDRHRERDKESRRGGEAQPFASMNQLDDYLELLYQVSGKTDKEREEGLRMQEKGTLLILRLCRDVMNLEQLIQNGTVMGAVTRVFQEEYKRSLDLSFNILRIFLAFSNFVEMHSLMAQYKIGVLTMRWIDFEALRCAAIEQEYREREEALARQLEESKRSGDPQDYAKALEKARKSREKEAAKQRAFSRKQDRVFFVAFYILLNLAEDASVEKKMLKKGLVQMLMAMLGRRYEDLLLLSLTFLKKLSVFEENKETFKQCLLVDQASKFLTCSSQPLVLMALRLLFNLSFDKDLREQMLKAGYVPKLVSLLKVPIFRAKTLKLLYHLSVDDRCKSMLTYTEGISLLMGLTLNFPQDMLAKELAALMINLSYHSRNVEAMLANKGLNLLMDRFSDKRDVLLMKIIRNVSLYTFNVQQELLAQSANNEVINYRYRGLWSPHVKTLIEVMMEHSNAHDLVVEIAGCLANMTALDLPASANWSRLVKDHSLLSFCARLLVPGLAQNDLVLEVVMLIGTIATDSQACELIASSNNLVSTLYQLLKDKAEDLEILLQLLTCFHRLLFTPSSREAVLFNTRLFVDIVDLLEHKNDAVRSTAQLMSDIVLEHDRKPSGELGNMGAAVLKKRFESFNRTWLASAGLYMGHGAGAGNGGGNGYYYDEEDDDLGLGDDDRLPSAQEHELSMITTAKFLEDERDEWKSEETSKLRGYDNAWRK